MWGRNGREMSGILDDELMVEGEVDVVTPTSEDGCT